MVCKFLVPLRVSTAVRSPSEAARFVGLLPYESNALVGGSMDETWRSIATVLSLRKGDVQDHAVSSLMRHDDQSSYVLLTYSIDPVDLTASGLRSGRLRLHRHGFS